MATDEFPEVLHTRAIGDTQRHRVTVRQWNARPDELVDEMAYWFEPHAESLGIDPWAVIDGIDQHIGGGFDVWFARGSCVTTDGNKPIYVSSKNILPLLRHLIEIDMHADSDIARFDQLNQIFWLKQLPT